MFLARSPIRSRSLADPQRTNDVAQVDCHRLAAGDGQHGLVLDLALQSIDAGISRDDALGAVAIASCKRGDGVRDLLLGKTAHLRDHAGDLLQVGVEGLGGVFSALSFSSSRWRAGDVSRSGR